jgi:hypothetical protein
MHLFRVLVTSSLILFSTCAAQALSYRVASLDDGRCGPRRNCPVVFVATGEIERREIDRFRSFVGGLNQRASGPRAVVIDSAGGNLAGAFALGLILRRIGVPVIVGSVRDGELEPGFCGSACIFALMGGRSRQVPPGSVVAVHAPERVPERDGPDSHEFSGSTFASRAQLIKVLADYARMMGVDPALIALTMSVPPDTRRELTAEEIRRFRLARTIK